MTSFSHRIQLPPNDYLGRVKADTLYVCTTDTATHLNLTRAMDQMGLQPKEAIELRDALNRAYPIAPKTFSEIKKGDTVTVNLTVTKVDTRYWTTMFSCDTPEWFEAEAAIGYVAPPPKPKIEAGQVRRFGPMEADYRVLATPADSDEYVACRYVGKGRAQPLLVARHEVEAAQVVS